MRIRLTIDLERKPKMVLVREEEHHPEGNNFSQTETSYPTTEPELITGFQRVIDRA